MDTSLLPQAAQSNDVAGALQKLLLSRIPTPEQEQWQKQARQDTMEDYQSALRKPAMGDYTPTMHSLYSMINNFGPGTPTGYAALKGIGSGGDMLAKQQALAQSGDVAAAKVAYENAKDEDKGDNLSGVAGLRALISGGKAINPVVKMDKDGNMVVYNPGTGETKVVHASQRGEYQRIWSKAYEQAIDNRLENPESYAHQVASQVLTSSPGFNPQDLSRPPKAVSEIPQVVPEPQAKPTSIQSGSNDDKAYILKQEWDRNQADIVRFKDDPRSEGFQNALRNLGLIRQEMKSIGGVDMVGKEAPSTAQVPSSDTMKYPDQRVTESQKSYGKEEGGDLYKERTRLSDLNEANTKLVQRLDLMEKLYQNPNIPEGELAPLVKQVKSGLATLGVKTEGAGPTDLVNALATQLSLTQKTADGTNLLPGAMSNYEDQLLQKMAPSLSLTNEGRLALVQFMKMVASSNMRLAHEANTLAGENKDMLPPSWHGRRERVLKEEMMKMRIRADKLMQQYGGNNGQ